MSCGIYMIENKINHHKYIGLSKNIERRWKEHINKSKHSLKKDDMDKALYKAIRKYGEENFIFTILEECEEKELKEREKFWIEYHNTYKNRKDYNETPGGDCSGINNVHVGEEHGMALLTKEEVRFYRIQYANGKRCKEIYLKYFKDKISYSGFSKMWHGKTWKHIMPETFNYNPHRGKYGKEDCDKINLLYKKFLENGGNGISAFVKTSECFVGYGTAYNMINFPNFYKEK